MANKCQQCGIKFLGRKDKVYCSDQCRSAFHNEQNSDVNQFVRDINTILRRNRRILEELKPKGRGKVHRDKLLEEGFKFSYFTNQYVTKGGKAYNFCYEYGYLHLNDDYLAIVERKEYVE
jgi:hypothetical protein